MKLKRGQLVNWISSAGALGIVQEDQAPDSSMVLVYWILYKNTTREPRCRMELATRGKK